MPLLRRSSSTTTFYLRQSVLRVVLGLLLLLSSVRSDTEVLSDDNVQRNVNRGSVRILILLVRFTNHLNVELPPPQHFQDLCETQLQPYLFQQSYQHYNIQECHVLQDSWHLALDTEGAYAAGVSGFRGSAGGQAFFTPVLERIAWNTTSTDTSSSTMNWSDLFDVNRDGFLDQVLVVHSGFSAESGKGTACNAPDTDFRIRSQGYRTIWPNSLAWQHPTLNLTLGGYAVVSAFDQVCNFNAYAKLGVMAHELLHTLGALDVYDTSTLQTNGKIGGLGSFDIMANPFGPADDTNYPGSASPYSKQLCGWLDDNDDSMHEITYDGIYTLRPSQVYPDIYKIQKGYPPGEYLVLEHRSPRDFDALLFGNGGLLIYHVDTTVRHPGTAGYPGQAGWPHNGNHYRVALLPADGNYDLELGVNNGDAGDFWTPGMSLGPDVTHPNTHSYQYGQIASTGIRITVLEDLDNDNDGVRIQVTGVGEAMGTVPPTVAPVVSNPDETLAPTVTVAATESPTSRSKNTASPSFVVTEQPVTEPTKEEPSSSGRILLLTRSSVLLVVLTAIGVLTNGWF